MYTPSKPMCRAQLVVVFGVPYDEDYYTKYGSALTIIFSAMPWAPFMKAIGDLGDATAASSDDGISWKDRYSYCSARCSLPHPRWISAPALPCGP